MEVSEASCKVFYLMRVWSRHLAGIFLVICSFIPQRGDLKPRASILDFSAASPGGLVKMHIAAPPPELLIQKVLVDIWALIGLQNSQVQLKLLVLDRILRTDVEKAQCPQVLNAQLLLTDSSRETPSNQQPLSTGQGILSTELQYLRHQRPRPPPAQYIRKQNLEFSMWSTRRLRDAATILTLFGINETKVGDQREMNTCREMMCLQSSLGRPMAELKQGNRLNHQGLGTHLCMLGRGRPGCREGCAERGARVGAGVVDRARLELSPLPHHVPCSGGTQSIMHKVRTTGPEGSTFRKALGKFQTMRCSKHFSWNNSLNTLTQQVDTTNIAFYRLRNRVTESHVSWRKSQGWDSVEPHVKPGRLTSETTGRTSTHRCCFLTACIFLDHLQPSGHHFSCWRWGPEEGEIQ